MSRQKPLALDVMQLKDKEQRRGSGAIFILFKLADVYQRIPHPRMWLPGHIIAQCLSSKSLRSCGSSPAILGTEATAVTM